MQSSSLLNMIGSTHGVCVDKHDEESKLNLEIDSLAQFKHSATKHEHTIAPSSSSLLSPNSAKIFEKHQASFDSFSFSGPLKNKLEVQSGESSESTQRFNPQMNLSLLSDSSSQAYSSTNNGLYPSQTVNSMNKNLGTHFISRLTSFFACEK